MPIYVTVLKSTAEAIKNMGDAEKWWQQGKRITTIDYEKYTNI